MDKSALVLVVEDDLDIQTALTDLLEFEGYQVVCASNGREGLERLRAPGDKPRLIILDMMMPVMSGGEFRAHQLADAALAAIPVVVLSAARDGQYQKEITSAAAYLKKPINLELFLSTIRKLMEA